MTNNVFWYNSVKKVISKRIIEIFWKTIFVPLYLKVNIMFQENRGIRLIVIFLCLLLLTNPILLTNVEVTSDEEYGFPYPGDDWAWSMIGTEYAHGLDEYGEDVLIAVLDTGIDYKHPDLEDKMWDGIGYNFVDDNDDPMDQDGHGTHVSGIISSVAPETKLMALKVIEREGGRWQEVAKAIRFARDNGADIISMSFGGGYSTFSRAFEIQLNFAYNDDILLAGAAGNEDTDDMLYPAAYESVMAVSAVNTKGEKASYSNYGDWIDLAAPGGGIEKGVFSTLPGGSYGEKRGTSMACPFVTGVAALTIGASPEKTNEEVRKDLQEGAIDWGAPGFDPYYGYGLINAYRAAGGKVPTPVRDLKADVGNGWVELSWTQPWNQGIDGLDEYRVYRYNGEAEGVLIETLNPNMLYYNDTSVENNMTYHYYVTSINEHGESSKSQIIRATPRGKPVSPSSPTNINVSLEEEGVKLRWKEPFDSGNSPITYYRIYRNESNDTFEYMTEIEADKFEYLDNTIFPGTEYTYAVTAVNEVGEGDEAYSEPIHIPDDFDIIPEDDTTSSDEEDLLWPYNILDPIYDGDIIFVSIFSIILAIIIILSIYACVKYKQKQRKKY